MLKQNCVKVLSFIVIVLLIVCMMPMNNSVLASDIMVANSEVEPCDICEGSGNVEVVDICSECDGNGKFPIPSECSECWGKIVSTNITNKPFVCEDCGTPPIKASWCMCGYCDEMGYTTRTATCSVCEGSGIKNDVKGLDRIEISKKPEKIRYSIGEDFDSTGMEVVAYYKDGTNELVDNYTVEGFSSEQKGFKNLDIRYFGKTVNLLIDITPFEGSGSENDPFLIKNQEQLCCVKDYPRDCFKLMNDIEFETRFLGGDELLDWVDFVPYDFYGTFDGNGHKISNLSITNHTMESVEGGFCYTNHGVIKNLIVDGCTYSVGAAHLSNTTDTYGSVCVGAVAADNRGTIENCFVTGEMCADVRAHLYIGGIAGTNHGIIKNCCSDITIDVEVLSASPYNSYSVYIGGIVGQNGQLYDSNEEFECEVKDSFFTGNIISNAIQNPVTIYVGGLVGSNESKLSTSYNVGSISLTSTESEKIIEYLGGIAGASYSNISTCVYLDEISQGVGFGNASAQKASSEEMKNIETYVEFDFDSVWYFSDIGEYLYPQLVCFKTPPFVASDSEIPNRPIVPGDNSNDDLYPMVSMRKEQQRGDVGTSVLFYIETESGYSAELLYFNKPITNTEKAISLEKVNENLYKGTFIVDEQTESGVWKINRVAFTDEDGDWEFLRSKEFYDGKYYKIVDFSNVEFIVVGTTADVEAPILVDINIDNDKVTVGDTIMITAVVEDEHPKDRLYLLYKTPSGEDNHFFLYNSKDDPYTYQITIEITEDFELGSWTFYTIWLEDTNENAIWLYDERLAPPNTTQRDFSHLDFEVVLEIESSTGEENPSDSTEPSISDDTKPSDSTEPSTGDGTKPSEPVVDKGILGDVNGDGKVNIKDATAIQKHIANLSLLTEEGYALADVNQDTKVNIKDATAIQKHIAGIETGLPIGKSKANI